MVTIKWLFSGTLDWIKLTCNWTVRLQSSSPLLHEFVIQGYNVVFSTLFWMKGCESVSSIFVSSSQSSLFLTQPAGVSAWISSCAECWDGRCSPETWLQVWSVLFISSSFDSRRRHDVTPGVWKLSGGGVSGLGDMLLLLWCGAFSLFVSFFPHFCHKQNSMKSAR